MLRAASTGWLERQRNDSCSLGAEAACRFLQRMGFEYDSKATASTSEGSTYTARRKTAYGLDATRAPDHSRESASLLRSPQRLPQERSMYIPSSRRHGWGGCTNTHHNFHGGASHEEPWSAECEQHPAAATQTLLESRMTSNVRDPTGRLMRGSNPSDSPKLPSKSQWVVHGVGDSSHHHDGVNSAREGGKDADDPDVHEGRRTKR